MTKNCEWLVVTSAYLNHALHSEGATVVYDPPEGGQVADNLMPANDAAQAWIDAQTDAHPAKKKPKAAKKAKGGSEEPKEAEPAPEDDDPVA